MARDDDDALDWGGDSNDPTYIDGRKLAEPDPEPDVESIDDENELVAAGHPVQADARPSTSAFLLYAYGVFAAVYLLYLIGWIVAAQRDTFSPENLFFQIMYELGEFLAIVAPALWLGLAFLLTRSRKPVVRVGWLLLGAVVLIPWPFIVSGSVA